MFTMAATPQPEPPRCAHVQLVFGAFEWDLEVDVNTSEVLSGSAMPAKSAGQRHDAAQTKANLMDDAAFVSLPYSMKGRSPSLSSLLREGHFGDWTSPSNASSTSVRSSVGWGTGSRRLTMPRVTST